MTKRTTMKILVSLLTIPFFTAILIAIIILAKTASQPALDTIFPSKSIPQLKHAVFMMIVVIVTIFALYRSKNIQLKAAISAMPLANVLITFSLFSDFLLARYIASVIVFAAQIFCLYLQNKSWHYSYAAVVATLMIFITTVIGIQI